MRKPLSPNAIQPDGSLIEIGPNWLVWPSGANGRIEIDGHFTADYLEALA